MKRYTAAASAVRPAVRGLVPVPRIARHPDPAQAAGSHPQEPFERSKMLKMLQAGAVPFRIIESRLEFLLVTSRRGNWIFPKGVVEGGETPEETARKEVEEEAGISGTVLPEPLGSYKDRKFWNDCEVRMFLLEYAGDSPRWGDAGSRAKRWCSFDDAIGLLKKGDLRQILRVARERLETRPHPAGDWRKGQETR